MGCQGSWFLKFTLSHLCMKYYRCLNDSLWSTFWFIFCFWPPFDLELHNANWIGLRNNTLFFTYQILKTFYLMFPSYNILDKKWKRKHYGQWRTEDFHQEGAPLELNKNYKFIHHYTKDFIFNIWNINDVFLFYIYH